MIIHFSDQGAPALLEPEDFRAFKIVVPAGRAEGVALAALLSGLAEPAEGDGHAWVSIPAFLARFAAGQAEGWDGRFSTMIEKAGRFGYVDAAAQTVRAHIETQA